MPQGKDEAFEAKYNAQKNPYWASKLFDEFKPKANTKFNSVKIEIYT